MKSSEKSPSAILGNFIPVSASGPLSRPVSSQRAHADVGLHIHLSLTDSQMDRLAYALPSNGSPQRPRELQRRQDLSDASGHSPSANTHNHTNGLDGFGSLVESARARHAAAPVRERHHGTHVTEEFCSTRPAREDSLVSHERHNEAEATRGRRTPAPRNEGTHHICSNRAGDGCASHARSSRSRSPFKRSRSPDKTPPIPGSMTADFDLAERRRNPCPAIIDIDKARHYGSVSKKVIVVDSLTQRPSQQGAAFAPNTPPTPLRRMPRMISPSRIESDEDEGSSYYSEDEFGQAHPSYVSPLRMCKDVDSDNNIVMRSHSARRKSPSPERPYDRYPQSPRGEERRGLQNTAVNGDLRQREPVQVARNYSPLSDYLSSRQPVRRKEMVGKHGWLERTSSPKKEPIIEMKSAAQQQKKKGFLNNLKRLAKDITLDLTASATRSKIRESDPQVSRLTVSLDPREQSLLYCELEFLLTTALEGYINSQFNAGRLDANNYKKIVDGWQQRGRPKVIGFRYDLETQLDLVLLHSEDFRFYGKRAGLIAAVNGVLDMMRVDARAMRIRTFCQPDTVVAKQLLDAQSLFNLIGCCEQQQIQLAEVIQFFKVILEREQNYRRREDCDQLNKDEQQWRGSGETGTNSQPNKSHSSKNSAVVPDCSSV